MRILMSGTSGTIGSAAAAYLAGQGHDVVRLVRRAAGAGEVQWDPDAGTIDAAGLEGFDGVVHVASMPWAGRWTPAFKERIRANRLATNGLLAQSLARCTRKPRVLVCASGMGIYAPAGDECIDEDTRPGTSFLAQLQQAGEAATAPAAAAGIRVVHLRIPAVLGGDGLLQMAGMARRGIGHMGNGRQWSSWVSRDELARIIEFVLEHDALAGPVNPTSPNAVQSADMTATLGRVLGCRPRLSMPAFVMRLMMGEMADELILASRRIIPRKLLAAGYVFRYADLEGALRHELGNT